MDNKEQCRKLANRIYELDEKVYKTSGSGLGKTFTGEKAVKDLKRQGIEVKIIK